METALERYVTDSNVASNMELLHRLVKKGELRTADAVEESDMPPQAFEQDTPVHEAANAVDLLTDSPQIL